MTTMTDTDAKQLPDAVRGPLYFFFTFGFLASIVWIFWPVMLHIVAIMSGPFFAGFSLKAMGPNGFLGPTGLLHQDSQ